MKQAESGQKMKQTLDAVKMALKEMKTLADAVKYARLEWQSTHGTCSMCDVGDKSVNGLHRGLYVCGNQPKKK